MSEPVVDIRERFVSSMRVLAVGDADKFERVINQLRQKTSTAYSAKVAEEGDYGQRSDRWSGQTNNVIVASVDAISGIGKNAEDAYQIINQGSRTFGKIGLLVTSDEELAMANGFKQQFEDKIVVVDARNIFKKEDIEVTINDLKPVDNALTDLFLTAKEHQKVKRETIFPIPSKDHRERLQTVYKMRAQARESK